MNTCGLCGDFFPQCECQSVIGTCCVCGADIFGREDYAKNFHWRTGAAKFTCEACVQDDIDRKREQFYAEVA
jgi:hypothetical protein